VRGVLAANAHGLYDMKGTSSYVLQWLRAISLAICCFVPQTIARSFIETVYNITTFTLSRTVVFRVTLTRRTGSATNDECSGWLEWAVRLFNAFAPEQISTLCF
jgi:hypothetical protein